MLEPRDPKDDVAERVTDPDRVQTVLLCTEFDDVDIDVIEGWTDDERAIAYEWAAREHLHASDNDEVKRFAMPKHVEKLRKPIQL